MANDNNLEAMRHTAAHILAAAVYKLFPETKFGIGPAIENGFYYDFDLPRPLTEEDLLKIETEMQKIIDANLPVEHTEIPREDALQAAAVDQPYKKELIDELPDEQLSFYKIADFVDLCIGPHIQSTGEVKTFKLLSTAGAYWRGDEKNKMLTRIYGTAFSSKEELDKYLNILEEAKKRDHRKLGKELGLYVMSELVGPGLPLYTPKGALVRRLIQEYSNHLRQSIGYQEVLTPQINKAELFKVSGHYEKFKDDMFKVTSHYTKEEYYLKPMNCPQHTQIYAAEMRSYKDLPLRIADYANLYRDEKPGELNGLLRLRAFSQDDGHCFCREDQVEEEFDRILNVIKKAMQRYNMNYYIRLSFRDETHKEKYIGDDQSWQSSQKLLEKVLIDKGVKFTKAEGEAAFYGPKMDLMIKDSLGREWQLSTIQLDFNMPQRFALEYVGEDGQKYTPVMIHSAIVGSPERFMGILLEHYAGAFPFWLAPEQIRVIPISEKVFDFSCKVFDAIKEKGFRVDVDMFNETVGKKIRDGEMQKIPYLLIVGPKEVEKSDKELYVSVRSRKEGDLGQQSIAEFLDNISKE